MLDIKADIAAAERLLTDIARRQLPFATAMAINDTADAVKRAEELSIASSFDRPTPFTKKGVGVRRATKTTLEARVEVKPVQAGYLGIQATGGTRKPKGRALLVPVGARLNKYGNLPKGALARFKSKAQVFVTSAGDRSSRHLRPGVYQRTGSKGDGVKLLIAFEPGARYSPRFRFHDLAMRRARAVFADRFVERLTQALATARR